MNSIEFNLTRIQVIRVEHGVELIQFLTKFAKENKIEMAIFTAIGALKCAELGFYDQKRHEYQQITIKNPHEIASCIGNISIKDGKPFVHAHAILADEIGNVKAGHLLEGTIFASEVHLCILNGVKIERKYDKITGLSLWNI